MKKDPKEKCAVCHHPRSDHTKKTCTNAKCKPFRCEGFTTEAQANKRTAALFRRFGL